MNPYFSIAEIATALGISDRVVRIKSEKWEGGRKRSKGKGLEYPITLLPTEITEALREGYPDRFPQPEPLPQVTPVPVIPHYDDENPTFRNKSEQRLSAKLEIKRMLDRECPRKMSPMGDIEPGGKTNILGCYSEFARRYNAGELAIPGWVREVVRSVSYSTLQNWCKALKTGDTQALAGNYRGGKTNFIKSNAGVMAEVDGAIAHQGSVASPKRVLRVLKSYSDEPLIQALTVDQLRRYMDWMKESKPAKWYELTDPKAAKNRTRVAFGRKSLDLVPNQLWELDSSATDVALFPSAIAQGTSAIAQGTSAIAQGTGQGAKRHAIVACVDVATRRARVLVAPTSKSEAILLLLIRCLKEWGKPDGLKLDNGKDYASRRVKDFCTSLGIEIEHCTPFCPWEKPHVERFFGTFNHDLLPVLPGYVGSSVAERSSLRELKGEDKILELAMSAEDFQRWADCWIKEYENRQHSSLGFSPIEKLASYRHVDWKQVRLAESQRELEILALPRKTCTVSRQGIKLNNRLYIEANLADVIGERVTVLHDATKPERVLVLDESATRLICEAQWDTSLTSEQIAEIAAKSKVIQKAVNELPSIARRAAKRKDQAIAKNPEKFFDSSGNADVTAIEIAVDEMHSEMGQAIRALDQPNVTQFRKYELSEEGQRIVDEAGAWKKKPKQVERRAYAIDRPWQGFWADMYSLPNAQRYTDEIWMLNEEFAQRWERNNKAIWEIAKELRQWQADNFVLTPLMELLVSDAEDADKQKALDDHRASYPPPKEAAV
ncbi:Mu transposase C-terminal domain-containing protein [Leptolyngbyaceae cyanobacterium UHCC 1019]